MFSELVDSVVTTPGLTAFVDVLCQGTSGAPASAVPAAYAVRVFDEMYQTGARMCVCLHTSFALRACIVCWHVFVRACCVLQHGGAALQCSC